MFRRVVSSTPVGRQLAGVSKRAYTNYDHMKYPVYKNAVVAILGYFVVMWFIFNRQGSAATKHAEFKQDYLRVWRRKLGTGYEWADAWGPQIDTMYRNLPDEVE